jgi:hypothetical protein
MYAVEVADQFGIFVQDFLLKWAELRLILWSISL